MHGDFLHEPFWTMDSSEVILILTKPDETEDQMVLLNTQNRTASTIINMYPIGWLAADEGR